MNPVCSVGAGEVVNGKKRVDGMMNQYQAILRIEYDWHRQYTLSWYDLDEVIPPSSHGHPTPFLWQPLQKCCGRVDTPVGQSRGSVSDFHGGRYGVQILMIGACLQT